MLVVHHLNNSRSQRVLWLLEELGVPYRIERYKRDPQTMLAPPELRHVHPLGLSPVIEDAGVTLAESGAIVEYLIERYGDGRLAPPRGSAERLRYTYWLHYAEGSAMPPLLLSLVFRRLQTAPMPFFVRPFARGIAHKVRDTFIAPRLKLHFDFMESALADADWFAGAAFSGADVQMSFPLEAGHARGMIDASRPRLAAWLARIHARPAYQRALEQGGEYALLA